MKTKMCLKVAVGLLLLNLLLVAEEGMFPLPQVPAKISGMKMKPAELLRPDGGGIAGAVLWFGGGTGSFVSPTGLVLTNHHVAFGAIQRNSTPEQDYLANGFYARSLAEELPAPGYEARLLIEMEDITKQVTAAFSDRMPPAERAKAVERIIAKIETESEDLANGIEGRVHTMFDGASYYLCKYMKFKDIRLVYAPPQSIGNFGGEVDNWMWPRHTGDFSFMRVYCAPDGKPADYSSDNVPYKPRTILPISTRGLDDGELVFILGYPARTNRNVTSYAVAYNQEIVYPIRIRIYEEIIRELEEEGRTDPATELLLASRVKGFYNGLKNNQGLLIGFKNDGILAQKQTVENELNKKIAGNPAWQKEFGSVLPAIKQAYDDYYAGTEQDIYIEYLRYITIVADALTIEKWSREKTKPNDQRESGYYDYQITRTKHNFKNKRIGYHAPADARLLKMMLKRLAAFPLADRPTFLKSVIQEQTGAEAEATIDNYVDAAFRKTRLTQTEECQQMFDLSAEELAARQDPLIKLAGELDLEMERIRIKRDKIDGEMLLLNPPYFKALTNVLGRRTLPDANRSLRFTYGHVRGYNPHDAVLYQPQTSLSGVIAKHTGAEPFNVPAKLQRLAADRNFGRWKDRNLNDVPVAFLSDCDITGGNSGSPVLNAQGEVVGCAFDGNWEALTNDWQYNPAKTRTISVDIRYVLFVLEKFSAADELIKELDLR